MDANKQAVVNNVQLAQKLCRVKCTKDQEQRISAYTSISECVLSVSVWVCTRCVAVCVSEAGWFAVLNIHVCQFEFAGEMLAFFLGLNSAFS